jgi:hypothetical protein
MQNSTFNPVSTIDFTKDKLNKDAQGVFWTITAGTTANIDYTLTNDVLISGGHALLIQNASWGDKVDFQIVMGTTVISQYVTSWPVDPTKVNQTIPTSNYPAKIPYGFILRLVYHSTGGTNVDVAMGYNLEKVIV